MYAKNWAVKFSFELEMEIFSKKQNSQFYRVCRHKNVSDMKKITVENFLNI